MTEPDPTRPPRTVRPKWGAAILICAKCARKHPDGKALRCALKDEGRRHAAAAGSRMRKPKIVKTACLGLCPKGAVVAASSATLAAGEVMLLRNERDARLAVQRLLPSSLASDGG